MKKKTTTQRKTSNGATAPSRPGARGATPKPAKQKTAVRAGNGAEEAGDPEAAMQSILKEVTGAVQAKRIEHWEQVICPYCGEGFEIHIEAAEDGQTMYEDCHVCCKPISLHVEVDEEDVAVTVGRA